MMESIITVDKTENGEILSFTIFCDGYQYTKKPLCYRQYEPLIMVINKAEPFEEPKSKEKT